MQLETMSRGDMEMAVIEEDGLYSRFDEAQLLAGGYTDEEMRQVIGQWIEDGDETAL
jgi:hypothetical protein